MKASTKLVEPYEDKGAEAVFTFALSTSPGAEPLTFQCRTAGQDRSSKGPEHLFQQVMGSSL
jgi:hypothetical protein